MRKSQITIMPEFFETYIQKTPDVHLLEGLESHNNLFEMAPIADLRRLADKAYAPGKWTVREVLQHVIDIERVMAYRAMRISRNDKTPLPSVNEDELVLNSNANSREIDDLIEEFILLRKSSVKLLSTFNEEMLARVGTASGKSISALALGFVIIGHAIHHFEILRDRYLTMPD